MVAARTDSPGCGHVRRTASRRGPGRCPARRPRGRGQRAPGRPGSRRVSGGVRRGWSSSGGTSRRSGLGSRACGPRPTAVGRVERVEGLAGFDQAAGVVGDLVAVELGQLADSAIQGAGVLSRFGRVLGDVGGDSLLGDVGTVPERLHGPDVELRAPAEGPGRLVLGGRDGDRGVGVCRSCTDRVGEQVDGRPGRGGVSGPSGPSSRITAWKCRAPRFWNSATLPYDSRARSFSSRWVRPARAATLGGAGW